MSPDELWQLKAKLTDHQCAIEFLGGPFDGYLYEISFPLEELGDMVILPINSNVIRLLTGKPRGQKARASSVAIYELTCKGGIWTYQHLGATTPKQVQLDSWSG